jgi:dienelactone hydrolase
LKLQAIGRRTAHGFGLLCLTLNFVAGAMARETTARHESIEQSVRNLYCVCSADHPTFSPDGKKIAFLSNMNGSYQVWLMSIEGGYPRLVTNCKSAVHAIEWSPTDENCIAFGIGQGELKSQIYTIRPDGTEQKLVTPIADSRTNGPQWTTDGRYLFGSSTARNKNVEEPCLLDPHTGNYVWLTESKKSGRLFDVSKDGQYGLTGYFTSFNDAEPYLLKLSTKSERLLMPDKRAALFNGVIGSDGRTIYCVTGALGERRVLARIKIDESGKPEEPEVVAKKDDADLTFRYGAQLAFDRKRAQAALVWRSDTGNDQLELLNLLLAPAPITVPFPPGTQWAQDAVFSPDGRHLAMALSKDLENIEIWLMDVASKEFRQLTYSPHPGVNFDRLAKPEFVTFKSFDDLELHGLLYKPKSAKSPGAFVIDFHGGPAGVAEPSNQYQPFLEQGIGVFTPNIRGSSGRGKAFAALDDGALRMNAVKDIKACVDYLVTNKIADSHKIGVMGHSAGGFLSMSALTDYPDLFAAGVEDNGTIDLLADVRRLKSLGYDCKEFSGPVVDEKMLRDISPAYKSERIKAPFLIQQGADDMCTPDAEEVAKKLKARGARVEYMVYTGEGHNLDKVQDHIDFITHEVEFFVKYLRPTPDAN